ncbi:MAG: PilN domain-containing protein [Parahaliea sp.]
MSQTNNVSQWQLFGFDVRHIGHYWKQAWAQFLLGDRSPVRERLDEVVRLCDEQGSQYYHAGHTVPAGYAECQAVALPQELVLFKHLRIPRAAEAELDAVMSLEVSSNSPFPTADTAFGWALAQRDEQGVDVLLAIASLSATMRYLDQQWQITDINAREVWAVQDEVPVVLRGFGEQKRLQRYKRRLQRMGLLLVSVLGIVVLSALIAAGTKYLQMKQYQHLANTVMADTRVVSTDRELVSGANQTIAAVRAVSQRYPNPHIELARLTQLLGDDTYIAQFSMRADEVRLRGRARDAAAVMEKLTSVPAFAEVSADEGGITRIGREGLEQFFVNIRVQTGDAL